MVQRLPALALAAALAGCGGGARGPEAPTGPNRPNQDEAKPAAASPRLVVLLVIDQWPAWAFLAKRPALTEGFDRLLREGEWHTGQHPTPATLTAPGHTLLGTGEPPYHSGILANEWWDRASEKQITSTEDGTGKSAKWLRVPGLGDAVAEANTHRAGPPAKAISVSLKDRAAILPLGHAGTAIWYDKTKVAWTSASPPTWLAAYNAAHPVAAHLHDVWTPVDPARLAKLSGTIDAQPGEVGEKQFGPTFPHDLGANKDPADAIYATPLGNQLVFETALAAIDGEHLGADATPDLLVMSLSAHDYVGHGWGHESWESWDLTLRLDHQLADLLAALDAKVGKGAWAMIVTSDHGASPLPERMPGGGGRISFKQVGAAANAAATTELGQGAWIANAKFPNVYLTAAARAKPAKDLAKALGKIVAALRSFPGLAKVGLTSTYAGGCEQRTGEAFAICQMIDPERSGEVFYLPARGWITEDEDEPLATAHGSFNDYDREVPVILLPPGRVPHTALAQPSATTIQMVRIATLLARWLDVTPPTSLPRQNR